MSERGTKARWVRSAKRWGGKRKTGVDRVVRGPLLARQAARVPNLMDEEPGAAGMIGAVWKLGILLILGWSLLLPPAAFCEEAPLEREAEKPVLNDTVFGRAVRLEQTISGAVSSTTGLAISPLLGMGVLGAWQYWKAAENQREGLPWYTHPAVWGICLGLFLLRGLKDTAGIAVPEMLKKPFTVLEVLENQLSAAVVALAVLPASVISAVPEAVSSPAAGAWSGGGAGVWAMLPMAGWTLLLLPPLLLIFTMVSTVAHAVKCLLLVSPSSLVNSGIKLAKGGFLAFFAATAYFLPWAGVILSLIIVLVCARLFGWAFRWNVYGTLFAWDFLGSRFDRSLGEEEPMRGFLAGRVEGIPPRTYGTVKREGETLIFAHRPWLILPAGERRLPLTGSVLGLRKGLLFPSITLRAGQGGESPRTLMEMRLRFRGHEDELARRLGAVERPPSRVIQGARNALSWLWEQVRSPGNEGERAVLPG